MVRELISGEWIIYHDFLCYNPMAAMFDWLDLCLHQEANQANGQTSWAQSPAKWKIYHHTRFRVLSRTRWIKWMEDFVRRKLRERISLHKHFHPDKKFEESRN